MSYRTLILILLLTLTGCAVVSVKAPSDEVQLLLALPDATVARKQAPIFWEQSLKTVTQLKYELSLERAKKP